MLRRRQLRRSSGSTVRAGGKPAILTLAFLALVFGLYPSSALAAPPTVTNIQIANLIAGVAASVSYEIDDENATVSCQWQASGTSATPGTWADIGGATACTGYSAPSGSNAKWHRILITASNAEGSATYPSRAYRLGGEVLGNAGCGSMQVALANGSSQSLAVPAPGNGAYCYAQPDLSPNGALIVFERKQTSQAKSDLWLMDGARTGARQLTNTSSLNESDARFSPDGTRIAFRRSPGGLSTSTIVVYDLTTGLENEYGPFLGQTANSNGLEWLDDSTLLFFAEAREGNTYAGDRWRYFTGWPLVGSGRTTDPAITCPYGGSTQNCTFIHELWSLDLSSGAATQVTDTPGPTSLAEYNEIRDYKINPRDPRVSPDGRTLVHNNSQNGRMLQIDTSTWVDTWTSLHAGSYAWRSDGAKIFWSKPGWSSPGVYTVNPDTSGSAPYMTGFFLPVYDYGFIDPAPPPASVAPPTITGFPAVGETLSGTAGQWVPTPTSSAYQWLRCDEAGDNCADIAGADDPTYLLSADDVDLTIRLRVTATNAFGSSWALSTPTDRVMSLTEVLAHRFRPILRFDNSEKWRPLNVETFLLETHEDAAPSTHHQVCPDRSDPGEGCIDALSWETLQQFPQGWGDQTKDNWPYIDIHGGNVFPTPEDYQSPYRANCNAGDLLDCDANSLFTSIYWHTVGPFPESNYRYLDYWFFYRMNWFEPGFSHEGDWEGATIAVSASDPDPSTFAFAALSAHGRQWHYLRPTLICDSSDVVGSCGAGSMRVNVFVANDSHANYPQGCSAFLGEPTCPQTDESTDGETYTPPDKGYDGSEPWLANDDPEALRAFPAERTWVPGTVDPSWVDWYGLWGAWGAGVESPAAFRDPNVFHNPHLVIRCTERYTNDEEVNCDGSEGPGTPRISAQAFASPCEAWNGPFVVASVCDPSTLLKALRAGTIEQEDGVRLLGNGVTGRTYAAANGIDQLVGSPLKPGERLRVVGDIGRGTLMQVRVAVGDRTADAVFRLPATRSATVVLGTGPGVASLRIIDAQGAAHRPIAVHLSEAATG